MMTSTNYPLRSTQPPMILMHVVWMPNYCGHGLGMYPGGFKIPRRIGSAAEMFNFKPFRGRCYGHVEMLGRAIRVERLGAARGADQAKGVLVVWTAPNPMGRGRTVVGWYQKTTVYRDCKRPRGRHRYARMYKGIAYTYRVEAAIQDCVLLPVRRRRFHIPPRQRGQTGVPGQSPLFYLSQQNGAGAANLEQRIRIFISNYVKNSRTAAPSRSCHAQSRGPRPPGPTPHA